MKNESPIIIIGMHRSGTTMLCKLLEKMGLFVGSKKRKNYEATFFQKVNKYLLYQANTTWDNPSNINFVDSDYFSSVTNVVKRRINSLYWIEYLGLGKYLKQFLGLNKSLKWAWKDPVNSITIDVWKSIFPKAKIVYVYRNPIDVAASLKRREAQRRANRKLNWKQKFKQFLLLRDYQFNQSYLIKDIEQGIALWEQYVKLNEQSLTKYADDIYKVKYEDLLERPIEIMKQIATFCQLDCSEGQIKMACKMVNPDKKYSFINDDQLYDLYQKIQNREMVKYLGYDEISR